VRLTLTGSEESAFDLITQACAEVPDINSLVIPREHDSLRASLLDRVTWRWEWDVMVCDQSPPTSPQEHGLTVQASCSP
jgi:hypothetical protein